MSGMGLEAFVGTDTRRANCAFPESSRLACTSPVTVVVGLLGVDGINPTEWFVSKNQQIY